MVSARENIESFPGFDVSSIELELLEARCGVPVARCNGTLLNSSYDPVKEAEQRAAQLDLHGKKAILLFGDGFYYLADYIAAYTNLPVVVIEAEPTIAKTALKARGAAIFDHFSLVFTQQLCAASDLLNVIPSGISLKELLIVEHMPSKKLFKDEYQRVATLVVEFFKREVANLGTTAFFGRRWLHNILDNLRQQTRFYNSKELKIDGELVIAVPGPSLDAVLPFLVKERKNYTLLALAPAVRCLQAAGLQPDMVCTMDGGYANALHLAGITGKDIPLLFPLYVNPSILRLWQGPLLPVGFGLSFEQLFIEKNSLLQMQETATVADFALQAALLVGEGSVFIAGQDFAAKGMAQHCRGYRFDQDACLRTTRVAAMELFQAAPFMGGWEWQEGYVSNKKLLLYKNAFLERALRAKGRVFQLTNNPFMYEIPLKRQFSSSLGGLSLPGAVSASVLEVGRIEKFQKKLTSVEAILKKRQNSPDTMDEVLAIKGLLPVFELLRGRELFSWRSGEREKAAKNFFLGLKEEIVKIRKKTVFLLKEESDYADI